MRLGFISYFLDIAKEEWVKYPGLLKVINEERDPACGLITEPGIDSAVEMEKVCIKVIVFLANYPEAYIWDFAAEFLSEKDAERLDKLGIIDKWEMTPKMAFRKIYLLKDLDRGIFKSLVQERNKLIHHKSISLYPDKDGRPVCYSKDAINIWERVRLADYFSLAERLVRGMDLENDKCWLLE